MRLSTPSLGITSSPLSSARLCCILSTPSLGITPEQVLYIPFPFVNFQLPLSGSLSCQCMAMSGRMTPLSTPSLGITWYLYPPLIYMPSDSAFNSLSRDHGSNAEISFGLKSLIRFLSTPSLGITSIRRGHGCARTSGVTFNSLSRDHVFS